MEVETRSNNNQQIRENPQPSWSAGDARFAALDQRTAIWILQVASRDAFDTRTGMTVRLLLPENAPEWEKYTVAL